MLRPVLYTRNGMNITGDPDSKVVEWFKSRGISAQDSY